MSALRLVPASAECYVAGNYGTGRRSGGVSTMVCAVLDDRRRVEEDDELKCVSTEPFYVRLTTTGQVCILRARREWIQLCGDSLVHFRPCEQTLTLTEGLRLDPK